MTSLAHRVLSSSASMLIIRFVQRGMGLISTLILARLLTPADFGLVAIVAIVVQLFDIVATTGSAQYIIQKADLHTDDLNTAWTIDILMKGGLQLLLLAGSPLVAAYYDKPELQQALWVASFSLPISALLNPGLILLKKDLDYKRILRLSIIQKFLSFAAVMIVVVIHPSYWALIVGDLVSASIYTLGSYMIHPYRPRLGLSQVRTQWSFSQWILLKSLFGYIRSQIDTILVSRTFSVADVGKYHMIKHLTSIPATDIISPAIEPLLSAFSISKQTNPEELPHRVRTALLTILYLITPLCVFIWNYPDAIIDALLGPQWADTYGILSALSLLLFAFSLNKFLEFYCMSQAKVKQIFIYDVLSMLSVIWVLFFFPGDSLEEFAFRRSIVGLGLTILFFLYIDYLMKLSLPKILHLILPIALASSLSVQITTLADHLDLSLSFIRLTYLSGIFFLIYFLTSLMLYALFYRNNSIIEGISGFLRPPMNRLFRRLKYALARLG